MAAPDKTVSLAQQVILEHGDQIENGKGKITYRIKGEDGTSLEIKIKKQSPSKSPRISPRAVKDKFKSVLPWNKPDPSDKTDFAQPTLEGLYSQDVVGDDPDHIYDQIQEIRPSPERQETRLNHPLPLPHSSSVPTSPTSTSAAKSSASLPDSFKPSGAFVSNPLPGLYSTTYESCISASRESNLSRSEYANPYEFRYSDPSGMKSPYYSQPPEDFSSARQHYDIPPSKSRYDVPPSKSRYDVPPGIHSNGDRIGTPDVNSVHSPYYLQPDVESARTGSSTTLEKRYLTIVPNSSRESKPTAGQRSAGSGSVKRPDFKKSIPKDITKCGDVDNDEWEDLCSEYAEYSSEKDVNDNYDSKSGGGGVSSQEYVTMRPSIKSNSRGASKIATLPNNVDTLKCPDVCDNEWDELCDELAN